MSNRLKTFEVYGPFVVPLEPGKHAKMVARDLGPFWNEVGPTRTRRGVYVFALRAGRGITPIYVGKTGQQTFETEAFTDHKLAKKYNPALLDYATGKAVMFFVAHPSSKGNINRKLIDEVETFLIGIAWQKNHDLANLNKTPRPQWAIKGVVRASKGKPGASATAFRRALGIAE